MANWVHVPSKTLITQHSPALMATRFGVSFVDGNGKVTPASLPPGFLYRPDLSAVEISPGVYHKTHYWDINGAVITLMDAAAQAVVDAGIAAVKLDEERAVAVTRAALDIMDRSMVEALLFEVNKCNKRIQELQDALNAVKATAGGSDNIRAAIPDPSFIPETPVAAFSNVNPKLRSEVLQKIVDDINNGVADP